MGKVLIPARSPGDWRRLLAEPEKHWRPGFSAQAVAFSWQEADGFPPEVREVLSQAPRLKGLEALIVIPEHQVPIPGGSRPSQSDVWVLGRTESGLVSVAVEGKVFEPFGPTVGEWLSDASDGKQERLRFLCQELRLPYPPPDDARYQLLHRAASALIEARRFFACDAVMLVHSFSQEHHWLDDYKRFLSLFGVAARVNEVVSLERGDQIVLHFAWIRGDKRYIAS
jgi:hypothetical protein